MGILIRPSIVLHPSTLEQVKQMTILQKETVNGIGNTCPFQQSIQRVLKNQRFNRGRKEPQATELCVNQMAMRIFFLLHDLIDSQRCVEKQKKQQQQQQNLYLDDN